MELMEELVTITALTLPTMPMRERMGPTGAGQAGERVGVCVLLAVCDAVVLRVAVMEDVEVWETVREKDGVSERVLVCDGDGMPDCVLVCDAVGVNEGVPLCVDVREAVWEEDGVSDCVLVREAVCE